MSKQVYQAVLDDKTCEACRWRHGSDSDMEDVVHCWHLDDEIGCRCVVVESDTTALLRALVVWAYREGLEDGNNILGDRWLSVADHKRDWDASDSKKRLAAIVESEAQDG